VGRLHEGRSCYRNIKDGTAEVKLNTKLKYRMKFLLSLYFGTNEGRRNMACGLRILELPPLIESRGKVVAVHNGMVWESGHAAASINFNAR